MPRFALSVLFVAGPLIASCDRQPAEPSDPPADLSASVNAAPAESESFFAPKFNPDSFVRRVDNRFFPLVPGTRFVYKGEEDGENEINVTLVTRDRKITLGSNPVGVLDLVCDHGELKHETLDWFGARPEAYSRFGDQVARALNDRPLLSPAGR